MSRYLLILLLIVSIGILAAVESDPSATVGYIKYPCVSGLNMYAIALDSGYSVASDLGYAYPGALDAINYWDNVNQQWVASTYYDFIDLWDPDFSVDNGMALWVNALSPIDLFSMGPLPSLSASYGILSGLNLIMVPLDQSALTLASELGASIGTLDAINYWDNANQQWVASTYYDFIDLWDPDFDVSIGNALWVNSLSSTTWPSARERHTVQLPARVKPTQIRNK